MLENTVITELSKKEKKIRDNIDDEKYLDKARELYWNLIPEYLQRSSDLDVLSIDTEIDDEVTDKSIVVYPSKKLKNFRSLNFFKKKLLKTHPLISYSSDDYWSIMDINSTPFFLNFSGSGGDFKDVTGVTLPFLSFHENLKLQKTKERGNFAQIERHYLDRGLDQIELDNFHDEVILPGSERFGFEHFINPVVNLYFFPSREFAERIVDNGDYTTRKHGYHIPIRELEENGIKLSLLDYIALAIETRKVERSHPLREFF